MFPYFDAKLNINRQHEVSNNTSKSQSVSSKMQCADSNQDFSISSKPKKLGRSKKGVDDSHHEQHKHDQQIQ